MNAEQYMNEMWGIDNVNILSENQPGQSTYKAQNIHKHVYNLLNHWQRAHNAAENAHTPDEAAIHKHYANQFFRLALNHHTDMTRDPKYKHQYHDDTMHLFNQIQAHGQ